MLDHISLAVTDLERSMRFYDAILEPLGYTRLWTYTEGAGYGIPGRDDAFAIRQHAAAPLAVSKQMHIAFSASGREAVVAFYQAAISNGAVPDGEPELQPMYGEGYFAAFVYDPDGYRLEAVYHEPVILQRTDEDLPACITALERVHKADGYPSSWPQDPIAWLTPKGLLRAWVARIGSSLVGHIAVGQLDPVESPELGTEQRNRPAVEVQRLFVVPHARRSGVAKALLEAAAAYAAKRGFDPVIEVTADRTAAIRLYEREDWRRVRTTQATWTRASGERPVLHHYELPGSVRTS